MIKTAIRNIVILLILDLIALPAGVALYLFHGFHIVHIALGFTYLYGIGLVYDTASILMKHVRIVNDPEAQEAINEAFYDETSSDDELIEESAFCCQKNYDGDDCDCNPEPMKPEMKQAMDEVFNLKK